MGFGTEEAELFFVTSEEEEMRVDKLLALRYPHYSRSYFQGLIEEGCVLVNGTPVKKRVSLEEGDEVEILFQALPSSSLQPEPIPLELLYEDEHLLVVNKPAGMVVHPAPGHWSGTFVNALLFHCQGKMSTDDPIRPGIVHRLDRETSGLLVAAKTPAAHRGMVDLFAQRAVEKQYLAVVCGKPKSGSISAPIGRHPVHRKEMTVLGDGREATTEIQLLAFNEKLSLLLVRPLTGRTHQIRVHCRHIGTPILGDHTYGSDRYNQLFDPPRHLLHAYRLSFTHPVTGIPLRFSAPVPEDFSFWMQRLCGPSLCSPALVDGKEIFE
ncbi:MAG: RluA family pseudouridine synthase [Verrucomicrobiota bacterium]|nr:RluA family pseudouridine synthase [Verrucomicrobiota bacterium]